MDRLLRRVPEVALLPELDDGRFDERALSSTEGLRDRVRIARLADRAYLGRLRDMLGRLVERATQEQNGGLHFVAASLMHFVDSLPPERHPLVVALYFRSLSGGVAEAEHPDVLAARMDDYEEVG